METLKFRKHPGGAGALVKSIKILLTMSLAAHLIGLIFSFYQMFTETIGLNVIGRSNRIAGVVDTAQPLSDVKLMGRLNYENANLVEWLFLPRQTTDFFGLLVSLFVVYYAYRIFKEINLFQPFYEDISNWMVRLYQVMIVGLIFTTLRSFYLYWLVSDLTSKTYRYNFSTGAFGYISIGTIVIVYIIVQVYKKGVSLQQEQNLVI
ncbi:DUF2975 domain-containing protein [Pedobacter sp. MC2016-24]|uniref:DUF2975 domain-containing protein n=1 Tax=Pedobacter sp. MC2016-24 TaxID=2780090 RepID=UPI00187F7B18|nr:DUF2975 domain-containing protein [Pedobacter sp. MC2016-24]MBE9600812.1 DUF2975 domain-containing protein [Pedobacter sp. MC2016-24]